MRNISRIAFGVAGIAFTTVLLRRFAARRHALPCPFWLSWLLENPFMNSVAGAEAILNRLTVEPGMKVLDVGCGPGRLTIPAARRVGGDGEVTALDIQPEMLRRVQKKLDAMALTNVRLIRAGAGEGKVGRNRFDRALLVTVLGEIPDRKAALIEIFQALKPGGILSITEVLPDPDFQTPGTVRRLASEVGFEEQAYFNGFPAFTIHLRKPEVLSGAQQPPVI
jgi:ubiquinone/menaquinone biosynthesis C-methylase UbiE